MGNDKTFFGLMGKLYQIGTENPFSVAGAAAIILFLTGLFSASVAWNGLQGRSCGTANWSDIPYGTTKAVGCTARGFFEAISQVLGDKSNGSTGSSGRRTAPVRRFE